MAIGPTLYNLLFKKSSTFVVVMIAGAIVIDTAIDETADAIFNSVNEGKLWHHIKHKYVNKQEEE